MRTGVFLAVGAVVAGGMLAGPAHAQTESKASLAAASSIADKCPTRAPAGSMRNGSEKIGVRELCRRSVRQARTPEAGKAIVYAFDNLGAPYSMSARTNPGTFDSTYLVAKAYESAGVKKFFSSYPWTGMYAKESAWKGVLARTSSPKPGDIRIMWRPGTKLADSVGALGHAQIYLADGYVIQSGGSRSNGDGSVNVASDTDWGWNVASFRHVGKR